MTQTLGVRQRPAPWWAKILVAGALLITVLFVGSMMVIMILVMLGKLQGADF